MSILKPLLRARTVLRLLLLVQAVAALLIALAGVRHGWPAWLALVAGVGAVALVRLAINLNNFVLAARHASEVPAALRPGLAGWLRMLAEEFRASMLVSHWHMPRPARPPRMHPGAKGPPVLLVHGYGASSGYWARLSSVLDEAGISHAAVDLDPVAADIEDYVPLIERAVAHLCAATGAPRVAIVGHSMGGLAARAWMRAHGTARLARLVTMGTPHHGTALARFGPGTNALQMRQGSPWLRALAGHEDAATRGLITSIYTHHDNIVAPQASSVLPGARNIAFGGVGHVALGSNPRVLAAVMRELADLPALAP